MLRVGSFKDILNHNRKFTKSKMITYQLCSAIESFSWSEFIKSLTKKMKFPDEAP